MAQISKAFQAYIASARLAWNMEGNWAPPPVYLAIALLSPAASVLIIVFMYLVILGDARDTAFIAFVIPGSAVYIFVRFVLQGCGYAVVEDREHYRLLRYIYIAPVPFPVQLFGRATPKLLVAIIGSALTILAGVLFLDIPLRPDGVDWGMLCGGLAVGLVSCLALGWILGSLMLLLDRMGWAVVEGLAGVMFLLSGMVIPLDILPGFLSRIGTALPMTYWAELWRHALFGSAAALSLPGMEVAQLWQRLLITTSVIAVVAVAWYFVADHVARRWGRIEVETFY